MGKLSGQVAMITGGNRGVGRGIARALAKEGARLVLTARNTSLLAEASQEMEGLGAEVLAVPADITQEGDVDKLFEASQARFGQLDILVSNAGAFDGAPFQKLTTEAWDRVINTNLRAPFLCGRAAFKIMIPQRRGRILNIGSISGQRPRYGTAPYTASKFGLTGLTHSMALDGRPYGIIVSCLHPGNVLTERRSDSGASVDQEPMMTVDELAEVALVWATLPKHVNLFEAIVLPVKQDYLGRG